MLQDDIIKPGTTKWTSPIVFAPKNDFSPRFCVDNRKLHAVTIPDTYPVPQTDECSDWLGEATVFFTLDDKSGYLQVEIDERGRERTVSTSYHEQYQSVCMLFGLKNLPTTLQRAMDVIMLSVNWQSALVYLADIVVFSKSFKQNLDNLRKVLTLLENNGVIFKQKRFTFFAETIKYLSHVIKPGIL